MNEIVNQLAQSLFKKNSLQECSRWELEILADHYPYFGIAQFLVTGKLKDENADDYDRQLEKTSLYFTNPLWLDYIINSPSSPATETATGNELAGRQNEDVNPVETAPAAIPETILREEVVNPPAEHLNPLETQQPAANEIPDAVTTTLPAAPPTQAEDETVEILETQPSPVALLSEKDPVQYPAEDPGEDNTNAVITEGPEEELKMKPFKFESMQDSNLKTPFTFEPYHTVDYFASQGIKMAQPEKPKDRFDQQLKSFTQWLKMIKKVPVAEITKEMAVDAEQKVITLAGHSIEDRDIVTEAMAEVWIKQGNREKAAEVYHKLSLQNPAKSSYFAGLIEQLKQQ